MDANGRPANGSGDTDGQRSPPVTTAGTANNDVPNPTAFQQVQQQRGSLSYFMFLSMMFFFMSSGGGPDGTAEMHYRNALTRLTRERDEFKAWLFPHTASNMTSTLASVSDTAEHLAESVYVNDNATSATNRTAFILQDLTPPAILRPRVDALLHEQSHPQPVYYRNVSGFFKGVWTSQPTINISLPSANQTELQNKRGQFPWTGLSRRKKVRDGRTVRLNVRESVPHKKGADASEESKAAEVVLIRGSIEFQLHDMVESDSDTGNVGSRTVEVDLEGIHFLRNGSFFMHGAPPWKDLDMRQLPGLLLSNVTRNITGQTVLAELDARLDRIQEALSSGHYPESGGDTDNDRSFNCSFSMYGQMRPLPVGITRKQVEDREAEMRLPTGRSVIHLPPPIVDSVAFSRDCNLVIDLDDMQVLELDVFWSKAITYGFILALVTAVQTWVLVRQMEYTGTPMAISKVSHLTISIQVILDVYFCVTHLTLGIVTQNKASLALLVPGFFGIMAGLLFGLRYAAIIRVQSFRPATAAPVTTVAPVAPEEQDTPSAELANTTTPLLASMRAPEPSEGPEAAENRKRAIAFAICAGIVLLCFVFIGWFPIILSLAYSFWVPQIYHNAERGTSRNALLKQYIFCTTAARLFIPLYVWACPQNLLFTEKSPWVYALVAWQIFQVTFLLLQDYYGSRFFLPRGFWFPEEQSWDYHPIMPPEDIESGGRSGALKEVDCTICLEKIELSAPGRHSIDMRTAEKDTPVNAVGDVISGVRRGANRMSYMVPPCHHIAHTECLESWAAIKMECPLCRRPLPPF